MVISSIFEFVIKKLLKVIIEFLKNEKNFEIERIENYVGNYFDR